MVCEGQLKNRWLLIWPQISGLRYADDCAPLEASPEGLQSTLDNFNYAYSSAIGLKVDAEKMKVLEMKSSVHQCNFEQKQIDKVEHSCYLSSICSISKSGYGLGNRETDLGRTERILSPEGACLRRPQYLKTQRWLHTKQKYVLLSTLLCGCESWTQYRWQVRQLEKLQQRYLWRISRFKWDDFVFNASVLRKADIRKEPAKMGRTVLRMDEAQPSKRILYGEPTYDTKTSGGQKKLHNELDLSKLKWACKRSFHDGSFPSTTGRRTKSTSGPKSTNAIAAEVWSSPESDLLGPQLCGG